MPRLPIDTDLPVFLARHFAPSAWKKIEGRALVLLPDISGWNDFGNKFRAQMFIVDGDADPEPISIRLMFEDESDTAAATERILAGHELLATDLITDSFVSVLAETSGYRTLVDRLGFTDALGGLRKTHDFVVSRLEAVDERTIELSKGFTFTQGVLRDDATWAAAQNGGRYLTPEGIPDVDDAAHSFGVVVQLGGMQGEHRLEADFGTEFPLSRRTLVLVGENGVGKTRFLKSIIDGLQIDPPWAPMPREKGAAFEPRPQFSRLLVFSSATSDRYPISVAPWSGVDYRSHRMAGHPANGDDDLAQSLLACMRNEGEIDELSGRYGTGILDAVLDPLGIRDDLYVEVEPVVDDSDILPGSVQIEGRHYLPFFAIRGEQKRLQLQARMIPGASPMILAGTNRPRFLSSGEQALLRFAAHAIGSLRRGSIFLLDEPETHLHPNYVSIFMSILDRLLVLSRSVAIIATHSAYIVREVPARRVRMVRRDSTGSIVVEPPGMQTFGASIDTISQFVFNDIGPKHRFQTLLDEWFAETPNGTLAQFREKYRDDLNAETLSYVAQLFSDGR
ncbi:AAA family ATPase [uncultured Microbacterium sp.]|uniref:ATP-dependent nuclease n=1 Tax=uncultured Microbacterium sp. TaxID=191216 RepID=UPI0028E787B1|nr:AAA family ATPase [uncultured Microbacterium sp.]